MFPVTLPLPLLDDFESSFSEIGYQNQIIINNYYMEFLTTKFFSQASRNNN